MVLFIFALLLLKIGERLQQNSGVKSRRSYKIKDNYKVFELFYGVIYIITNILNGKQYIGQTIHSDATHRWKEHQLSARTIGSYALSLAIRKYGVSNFTFEVIWHARTKVDLDISEISFISLFNTISPNGYNLRSGGARGRHSSETKLKMSITAKKLTNLQRLREQPEIELKRKANARLASGRKETRDKISLAVKTAHSRPDVKIRHLEGIKASWNRPGIKEKHHNSLVEMFNRPGMREKHRLATIRALANIDDAAKERQRQGSILYLHTRWHVNRNQKSDNCPLCLLQPELT